jgi:CRP-like cAMP-binding protein
MQIAGYGRRVAFRVLEHLFRELPSLRSRILENAQYSLINARQLAACNALHSVSQRLARWLLMVQDRMQSDEFALTHEVLAVMLSAHRPTISIVAAALQREGIITYRHGHVRILQRDRLESASCDCHSTSHDLLSMLYK